MGSPFSRRFCSGSIFIRYGYLFGIDIGRLSAPSADQFRRARAAAAAWRAQLHGPRTLSTVYAAVPSLRSHFIGMVQSGAFKTMARRAISCSFSSVFHLRRAGVPDAEVWMTCWKLTTAL
eukprot:scaffold3643_cov267-Pinguiococcus_pyrenoidosus.AAC.2